MRPSSSPKRTAIRAIGASNLKALILDHELRQCFIIGDIGIGKAGLIQPFEKPVKLLGGFGFGPQICRGRNKHRAWLLFQRQRVR